MEATEVFTGAIREVPMTNSSSTINNAVMLFISNYVTKTSVKSLEQVTTCDDTSFLQRPSLRLNGTTKNKKPDK